MVTRSVAGCRRSTEHVAWGVCGARAKSADGSADEYTLFPRNTAETGKARTPSVQPRPKKLLIDPCAAVSFLALGLAAGFAGAWSWDSGTSSSLLESDMVARRLLWARGGTT